ncbi:MAG: DUF354 domain-containing protein [Candidatus Caldatribacteriaceae bacterium]
MEKHVLLLSNGYGEDSFARLIASALLEEAESQGVPVRLSLVPLVGEGKAFLDLCAKYPEQCFLLHRSPALRYGGVYLGNFFQRFGRFLSDLFSGGAGNIFRVIHLLAQIRKTIDMVVVVGDVFLLLLSFIPLRKKAYLFACAHTALLREKGKEKPYERLGKLNAHLLRSLTHKVYTRDHPTALWFQNLGIKAHYCGFVGPLFPEKDPERKTILFLPGHRKDWQENFRFLIETIALAQEPLAFYTFHFVFPPEPSVQEVEQVIQKTGGQILFPDSFTFQNVTATWSQGDYFNRLRRAALVVGFAGTALEHAAYLGIPCLEPYTERAIQVNRYFLEKRQQLLLREALIKGEDTPERTASVLKKVIVNLEQFQKRAEKFSERVWQGKENGAQNIARDLFNILCTPLQPPGRAPVSVGSHNGIP